MEMEREVRVRAGHKSRVTKLIRTLEEGLSNLTIEEAQVRNLVGEIKTQKDIIQEIDKSILTQCKDADVESEVDQASEFRMKADDSILKATTWLERKFNNDSHSTSVTKLPIKLPSINLRRFDGNPLDWCSFWDLFRSTIHDRTDLPRATKFYYLVSQLDGDASLLLMNFDHTDGSYTEAVQLLQRTYGNKKLLVQSRLHALLDLEPPEMTSTSIGKFRSQFEAHLRGLKTLGANINDASYIFCTIIMR